MTVANINWKRIGIEHKASQDRCWSLIILPMFLIDVFLGSSGRTSHGCFDSSSFLLVGIIVSSLILEFGRSTWAWESQKTFYFLLHHFLEAFLCLCVWKLEWNKILILISQYNLWITITESKFGMVTNFRLRRQIYVPWKSSYTLLGFEYRQSAIISEVNFQNTLSSKRKIKASFRINGSELESNGHSFGKK